MSFPCHICGEPVDERSHRGLDQCKRALEGGRERRDTEIKRLTERIVMLEAALAAAQKPAKVRSTT